MASAADPALGPPRAIIPPLADATPAPDQARLMGTSSNFRVIRSNRSRSACNSVPTTRSNFQSPHEPPQPPRDHRAQAQARSLQLQRKPPPRCQALKKSPT